MIALRSRDNTPAALLRMDKEHEKELIDGYTNDVQQKIKGLFEIPRILHFLKGEIKCFDAFGFLSFVLHGTSTYWYLSIITPEGEFHIEIFSASKAKNGLIRKRESRIR